MVVSHGAGAGAGIAETMAAKKTVAAQAMKDVVRILKDQRGLTVEMVEGTRIRQQE